jgi:hypothetical protein
MSVLYFIHTQQHSVERDNLQILRLQLVHKCLPRAIHQAMFVSILHPQILRGQYYNHLPATPNYHREREGKRRAAGQTTSDGDQTVHRDNLNLHHSAHFIPVIIVAIIVSMFFSFYFAFPLLCQAFVRMLESWPEDPQNA